MVCRMLFLRCLGLIFTAALQATAQDGSVRVGSELEVANASLGGSGVARSLAQDDSVAKIAAGLRPAVASSANASTRALRAAGEAAPFSTAAEKVCGINGVEKPPSKEKYELLSTFEMPADIMKLECGRLMSTNCTLTYAPMKCPDRCPYIVPSRAFSCMLKCVPAVECSKENPDLAFPNPHSGVCEKCAISSCKHCKTNDKCTRCHPGFRLTKQKDGSDYCKFELDEKLHLEEILLVVVILAVLLVLFAGCWYRCKGRHPNAEANLAAIERARRHRHLCKVCRWRLHDSENVRKFYPLSTNMHRFDKLGVGLPLFYNHIVFITVIAGIFFLISYFLQLGKAGALISSVSALLVSGVPAKPKEEWGSVSPATVQSPLGLCDQFAVVEGAYHGANGENVNMDEVMIDDATIRFYVLGLAWFGTFLLSLWFGWHQKINTKNFDKENVTMVDYAIMIRGLPKDLTDEETLRNWLQTEFRKVFPHAVQRAPKVIYNRLGEDQTEFRPPSAIEVHSVSIAYDYSKRNDEVNELVWNMIEMMEIELDEQAEYGEARMGRPPVKRVKMEMTSVAEQNLTREEWEKKQRDSARALFEEGPKKLKGTGKAVVVFKYIEDQEKILNHWESSGKGADFMKLPDGSQLQLGDLHSEPPSISWWYMGMENKEVVRNCVYAVAQSFAIIGLVQLTIAFPYYFWIVWPYARTGASATGLKTMIAGNILGFMNWVLFFSTYITATRIGFSRKDQIDVFVVYTHTCIVMVIDSFNIITMIVIVMSQHGITDWIEKIPVHMSMTVEAMAHELDLSMNLFSMLVPGSFFTGLITTAIMAGPVPFTANGFYMKIIYVWRCLPDWMLRILKVFLPWSPASLYYYPFRSAEKALDPWEVPIMGNYTDHISKPVICFIMLFFMSPYTYYVFAGMFAWGIFQYYYFKYMHLRYHKTCYFTTPKLNTHAMYLWGVPLSVVACASIHWGVRAGKIFPGAWGLQMLMQVVCFLASCALWVVAYKFVVRPHAQVKEADEFKDDSIEEIQSATVYSWLNVNPPYALKCKYYFQDKDGEDILQHGPRATGGLPYPETDGTRRNGHPLACGEEKSVVRIYEVGKEYLFVKPDRQKLIYSKDHNLLEFETWFEFAAKVVHALAACCVQWKAQELPELPQYTNEDAAAVRRRASKYKVEEKEQSQPLLTPNKTP